MRHSWLRLALPLLALWATAPAHAGADSPGASRFSAKVLVVTDPDWQEKWQSPAPPSFTSADVISRGQAVHIMTFFVGAELDSAALAHVRCELLIEGPKGKVELDQKDMPCLDGPVFNSRKIHLSPAVVKFWGAAKNASGVWTVRARARDTVSGAVATSTASFTLR